MLLFYYRSHWALQTQTFVWPMGKGHVPGSSRMYSLQQWHTLLIKYKGISCLVHLWFSNFHRFLTQETCQHSPICEEDVNMLMNSLIQPVGNSNVLERGLEAAGHFFRGEVPAQADSFILFFQRSHESGI